MKVNFDGLRKNLVNSVNRFIIALSNNLEQTSLNTITIHIQKDILLEYFQDMKNDINIINYLIDGENYHELEDNEVIDLKDCNGYYLGG